LRYCQIQHDFDDGKNFCKFDEECLSADADAISNHYHLKNHT